MQYEIHAQDGPVVLRPLRRADAGLILSWLTDPRNLEYWEGPGTVYDMQRVIEDFYQEEWNASKCMIVYEGQDVGYVQAYLLDEEMRDEYEYSKAGLKTFGIDQFIGVPELWGQGIGRRFVDLLCRYLEENCGAGAIVLDPHCDNPRAIRCYEACGFKKLKLLPRHELHAGEMVDCWLMERRKTE